MTINPSFWDFRMLSRASSVQPSFHREGVSPLGILGRKDGDYPESIEMESREMANPYSPSVPGAPGNGYGKHLLRRESYPGKKVKFSGLGTNH